MSGCRAKHASFWKTTTTRCITARLVFGKSRFKSALGRKDLRIDLSQLLATLPEMGLVELPITAVHAAGVTRLSPIHRDPFDRLLIAQSLAEPLMLLTNDAVISRYRVGTRVV